MGKNKATVRKRKDDEPRVLFQIISCGTMRAELAAFFAYMTASGHSISVFLGHRGYMPMDRNEAIHEFLAGDEDILIQCDEDMIPPLTVLDMAKHGVDICGVLYLCGSDRGPMIAVKAFDIACECKGKDKECKECDGGGIATPEVYPVKEGEPSLLEVDWVGTGCYVITREAALKMIATHGRVFDFCWSNKGGKLRGVDVDMGHRAREAGLKVYCDRREVAAHSKGGNWAPTKTGQLVLLPWGSYWAHDEIPTCASERKPLPEVMQQIVKEYEAVEPPPKPKLVINNEESVEKKE